MRNDSSDQSMGMTRQIWAFAVCIFVNLHFHLTQLNGDVSWIGLKQFILHAGNGEIKSKYIKSCIFETKNTQKNENRLPGFIKSLHMQRKSA